MTKENQYFILQENRVPVVEIREIDYQVPSWEEFMETYREDERVTRLYEDIFQAEICQGPQYGPGNSHSLQSRESLAVNRTEFEVIGKEIRSGRKLGSSKIVSYVKFDLDSNLRYEDGECSHVSFVNRHPFNKYEIGDSLWIDLDKVRNKDSGYEFDDDNVVVRQFWNAENQKRGAKIATKGTLAVVSMVTNEVCPTLGDLVTDIGQAAGSLIETAGTLTGNETLETAGEVLHDGFSVGSSANSARNNFFDRSEHICFRDKGKYKRNAKGIGTSANVMDGVKELFLG